MNVVQFPHAETIILRAWHLHRTVAQAINRGDTANLRELRFALQVLRDTYPKDSSQWLEIHAHVAGLDAILPSGL